MSGRLLVTGGLGFIGSAFVRAVAADGARVVNLDAGTYAADERRLAQAPEGAVETVRGDVRDDALAELVARERPSAIVHFAAESHVTRSETAADAFFAVNVEGTRSVLEAALAASVPRVLHVSTDEVYGPCPGAPFREQDKLAGEGLATSAYARSKALADDLAQTYADRLDVVVVRPTNTIGPWQHPEKAVPRWATRALRGERLPVWGDGGQVRDWMYVDDAVGGIRIVLERGRRGEVYNLGPAAHGRRTWRWRAWSRAPRVAARVASTSPSTTGPNTTAAMPSTRPGRPRWAGSRPTTCPARSPRRSPGTGPTAPGGRPWSTTPRRSMPTDASAIPGVLIESPQVHADGRGRFSELYRAAAMPHAFAQSNHSRSAPGVLRGLHYHRRQDDLWYVVRGRAQVALADLRVPGPDLVVETHVLDGEQPATIYIPRGVATATWR